MGGFFKAQHGEGLYLTIYRNILEKRKRGIVFVMVTLLAIALSFKGLEKEFFDLLSPYYKYAYARVDFNKYSNKHPLLKEYPLLRLVKPTSEDPDSWPKLTSLSNSDEFAFIIFISNSNYIYSAVNTKLSLLKNDAHHFTTTLWADNAKPV